MRGVYEHRGWVGEPYKSDFDSCWGLIKFGDILDCSGGNSPMLITTKQALAKARVEGYRYFISQQESKRGNRLYKTAGAGKCVYGLLEYNRDHARAALNGYQNSLRDRVQILLRVVKGRAKKKGIAFDLDASDILQRFEKGVCERTGLPLDLKSGTIKHRSPFGPSLDQIVPGAGYTKDNVQVVCLLYNLIKSNFEESDVARVLEAMHDMA